MNKVTGTFLLLGGVLLIVGGIVLILVTGIDPLFSAGGVALLIGGGALLWKGRGSAEIDPVRSGPERSRQKPLDTAPSNKKR